ncbi:MAG: PUA domain-containing protein [Xanthomonadales bacterium]|nr:PUA domain-containing protein [Xanthomonadales bacterium]
MPISACGGQLRVAAPAHGPGQFLDRCAVSPSPCARGISASLHVIACVEEPALIARGTLERPISDVLEGKRRHIRCVAKTTPSSSWVLWMTNRLQIGGSLVIRQSAADALKDSRDGLSCADVLSMKSDFKKADVLHIYDEHAVERARGMSNLSSDEAQLIARNPDAPSNSRASSNGSARWKPGNSTSWSRRTSVEQVTRHVSRDRQTPGRICLAT